MVAAVNPEFVKGFGDIEHDPDAFQRMLFALNPRLADRPEITRIATGADRRRLRIVRVVRPTPEAQRPGWPLRSPGQRSRRVMSQSPARPVHVPSQEPVTSCSFQVRLG